MLNPLIKNKNKRFSNDSLCDKQQLMKPSFIKLSLLFLICLFPFSNPMFSQEQKKEEKSRRVSVQTKDNNVYIGPILERNEASIIIKDRELGKITILLTDIVNVKYLDGNPQQNDNLFKYQGKLWFDHATPNRYLLGSSAIPLAKGITNYQNGMLFYNSVGYGFTNSFSMSVGTLIPFPSVVEPGFNILIKAQWSFPVEDEFYFGFGNGFGVVDGDWATFPFIMATVGSKNRNATLSFGYGFTNDDATDRPIVSIAGVYRISKNLSLITENWYGSVDQEPFFENGVFSYGFRFMFAKTSLDFVFANNADLADFLFLGVPILNLTAAFGKKDISQMQRDVILKRMF